MSFNIPKPPYLGAAYYPEDWPLEQIDEDIRLMKEAGMNVMRIGEFAWSRMEPDEGKYDFDWLHLVVDKLAEARIATIMGTPTCTPPIWLVERYPEVLFTREDGSKLTHGTRRHYCPNSPTYRQHCERIVTRLAEEFGDDERVIGWQIDNELYTANHHSLLPCSCPVCVHKFQDFLRERYGTIENLNKEWCTNLWSQTYQSFSQLPFPRPGVWQHPSLSSAWKEFSSKSYVEFAELQADILHKLTKQPVGTDMMMIMGVDHYDMNKNLDVVQFNHYHPRESLWQAAFWFDHIRPIKDRPFWNTETMTSWGGNVATSGYCEEGYCRANSWMPLMMGGEANLYWLWRTHFAGHELMHGGVVTSCGRPMHIFGEVQELSRGFAAASEFLNGTKPVQSELGIHVSNSAYITFRDQPMLYNFDQHGTVLNRVYKPLLQAQFRMDVIHPSVDLSRYKMIITSFMPSLDEDGLRTRLEEWIRNGGILIAGPFTDIRNAHGAKFTHAPYGSLEDWGGINCKYQIPGDPRDFAIKWSDGTESTGSLWYDSFELRGAESLAQYTEGPMKGLAAASRQKLGKGRVVVLGTMPQITDYVKLITLLGAEAGVTPVAEASDNLLVVPRSGEAGEGIAVVEYENRPATLTLPREATDILTGKTHSGTIQIPAYGAMVLKY